MRGAPVVWFAAAYGAGLWIGLVLFAPLALVLALVAGALIAAARGTWPTLLAAIAAVGWLTGSLAYSRRTQTCAVRWRPGPQAAILRVHDAPNLSGITAAEVEYSPADCRGRLRVRFSGEEFPPAGARVVAVGSYLGGGTYRIEHVKVLDSRRALRYVLRERIAARISRLYGERAPVVDALVLGRRDAIDPALRRAFADAGIAHLLAISGLHVGILAWWVELVAGLLAGARSGRWIGVAAIWGYVSILGFPAPAARAAAFFTVRAIALQRQRHPPNTVVLALAALVVLGADPEAATDTGAWLSFAAAWGTAYGASLARSSRFWGAGTLAVSAGATLATAPITAYAFGSVAPIGVLTNLVAVPLAAIAVPGIFWSLLLGGIVAGGSGLALAAVERTAVLAASVPLGCVRGTPGAEFAFPWAVGLAAVLWVVRTKPRRLWAHKKAAAAAALAAWSWNASGSIGNLGGGGLSIHFLDVGQGDAIAIETPGGRWLLVDAGPRTSYDDAGRRVVLPFLRRHGVRKLAIMVVTHGDADHLGGAPALMRSLEPELVLEPGQPLPSRLYLEYLALVDRIGTRWRAARAGDTVALDGVVLAVLHPDTSWIRRNFSPNENSVVLRLSYGEFDAVLAGDIGEIAEEGLLGSVSPAEVLKVAHHGSRYSTSKEWLEALDPLVAVISVGKNRYGHPAPETIARLRGSGAQVLRTDLGGTVTIRSDGRYFEVFQGYPSTLGQRIGCLLHRLLLSSASSSSRSGCTPALRASYPTFSTTSRWPQK
ncbi:ComE operon protein 3 [bacterium HR33]|nr:ComE operon protein 3 [bacterium HR33]